MTMDVLSDLRGYHWPEPVSWWPPAPGWWLLAGVLIALTGLVSWKIRQKRRRLEAADVALKELSALQAAYEAKPEDGAALARGVSQLLRRFALARFPARDVAGLTGPRWLAFLDAHGGESAFSKGPGRVLSEAPYRARATFSAQSLLSLAKRWIERNQVRPR